MELKGGISISGEDVVALFRFCDKRFHLDDEDGDPVVGLVTAYLCLKAAAEVYRGGLFRCWPFEQSRNEWTRMTDGMARQMAKDIEVEIDRDDVLDEGLLLDESDLCAN